MTENDADYPRQRRTGPARFLPILGWIPDYTAGTARHDLIAGLTVAVMLVPQSMAYAALAGLPPQAGLYASVVPLLVYALLGTSGALAVGPVAIAALMTNSALAPLAQGDPGRYAALAGLLALMVGVIQAAMGVLRLGVVVDFLSHPVLSGFTSAAAILIAVGQLPALLGLGGGGGHGLIEVGASLWESAPTAHGPTIAVSALSIAALLLLRRRRPRFPGPLLVMAVVTAAGALFGFAERGVAVLGEVPGGLPAPALPGAAVQDITALLPSAAAIALVTYMEGIAVAKALAAKSGQRTGPDAELVAVGGANLAAGVFSAFPVAGGFSRSAVNLSAGARTPAAGIVTALVVALTALLLTPAFRHLPDAVLAAIVVVAVLGLVDARGAAAVWRARTADGLTLAAAFAGTLLFGVEPGLAAGIAFSLAVFLWRTSRPHIAELGRVPGTATFRNIDRYPGLAREEGIAVVRIDGPLYFANTQRVGDALMDLAARGGTRTLVLDASAIGDCDSDGAHSLGELRDRLGDRGTALRIATLRGPVRDLLDRAGVLPPLRAAGRVHADIAEAVAAARGEPRPPGSARVL